MLDEQLPDKKQNQYININEEQGRWSSKHTSSLFNHMVGALNTNDFKRFQRTIFRVSKGNCLVIFNSIELIKLNQKLPKPTHFKEERGVFILLYRGDKGSYTEKRLKRICSTFDTHL